MIDEVRRAFKTDYHIRSESTEDEVKIEGYASIYNQKTAIGNSFFEVIERGAFDETDLSDVLFLTNHNDDNITLARYRKNKKSTMEIKVDDEGLYFNAGLDIKNNSESRSLASAIKRNDVSGMSFRFLIQDYEWTDLDKPMPIRHIKKIKYVSEISAVNWPAYEGTSIVTRSKKDFNNDLRDLENAKNNYRSFLMKKEKAKLGGI